MTRSRSQDAPSTSGQPQDAPIDWPRAMATGAQSQGSPVEAGWHPSPDGSATLSWWTGQGWSRTQQPIPAQGHEGAPLTGRVIPSGPRSLGDNRWRRRRVKGFVPAILLTVFLGGFGLLFVNIRVAIGYWLGWVLLSSVLNDHGDAVLGSWSRPVAVGLAVLTVAVHNHGVNAGAWRPSWPSRRRSPA